MKGDKTQNCSYIFQEPEQNVREIIQTEIWPAAVSFPSKNMFKIVIVN